MSFGEGSVSCLPVFLLVAVVLLLRRVPLTGALSSCCSRKEKGCFVLPRKRKPTGGSCPEVHCCRACSNRRSAFAGIVPGDVFGRDTSTVLTGGVDLLSMALIEAAHLHELSQRVF